MTSGFIEEAQQIDKACRDTLKLRLRFRTKEYDIKGKLLLTCNPGDNFLYTEFWDPFKKGTLAEPKAFVQAFVSDNRANLSADYIAKLDSAPPEIRNRLRDGDWDYANVDNQIVIRSWIEHALVDVIPKPQEQRLGIDIADEGADLTIMVHWIFSEGIWYMYNIKEITVPTTQQSNIGGAIWAEVKQYAQSHQIGFKDIHMDTVGVGASARDAARGDQWMINSYKAGSAVDTKMQKRGGSAIDDRSRSEDEDIEQYFNLRSYSYWQFRLGMQNETIKILRTIPFLEKFIRDITAHTYDVDGKVIRLVKKQAVKDKIGRSPDFSDAGTMGFAPQLKTKFGFAFSNG